MTFKQAILFVILIGLFLLIPFRMAFSDTPTHFRKWDNRVQLGGSVRNYQETDSAWHKISNVFQLEGDSVVVADSAVIKTRINKRGVSIATFNHGGVSVSVKQRLVGLAFLKLSTRNFQWIDSTMNWSGPTIGTSDISWNNVSPGVDYKITKSDGELEHRIFFKPGFLDSAVALYETRADSLDIALANVIVYTLTNVDNPDSLFRDINWRGLKEIGTQVFGIGSGLLSSPDTSIVPVRQHWKIRNGKLIMIEWIRMSDIARIHRLFPTDNISHNASPAVLDNDSKMEAQFITNWSTLANNDTVNTGGSDLLNIGCRSGIQRFLVEYDTTFTESITSCTLYVTVWAIAFFASDDDTASFYSVNGTRTIAEGTGTGVAADTITGGASWKSYVSKSGPDDYWGTAGGMGSGDTSDVYLDSTISYYVKGTPNIAADDVIGIPLSDAASSWPTADFHMIYDGPCTGSGGHYVRFNSDDHVTVSERPYIVVNFTTGGADPLPTRRRRILLGQ